MRGRAGYATCAQRIGAVGDGVVTRLRELDRPGRIGIPGLVGSPRFPDGLVSSGFLDKVREAFPTSEIVDATALLDELRSTKSAEERAAVTEAIALAESAFDVLLREARPGVAERVVYGRMVGDLIERGSIPTNFLMWSAGANFGNSLAPFPTARPLRAGEPVYCEIEARSAAGYLGQITRMASLGAPAGNLKQMFDVAAEAFEGVLTSMAPGATMRDVLNFYKECSTGSRYDLVPVIHTRALGEDRPMIVFQTEDPDIVGYEIREHHIYAVKVQVRDASSGQMAFWGESVAIGPQRAEQLGHHPVTLPIIA